MLDDQKVEYINKIDLKELTKYFGDYKAIANLINNSFPKDRTHLDTYNDMIDLSEFQTNPIFVFRHLQPNNSFQSDNSQHIAHS